MVITQKVTSLAYNIHDGLTRQETDLTKNQKYYVVHKVPSPLEYFSYVLHFQALMAGPVLFYVDYINFIQGTNLLVQKPTPSVSTHFTIFFQIIKINYTITLLILLNAYNMTIFLSMVIYTDAIVYCSLILEMDSKLFRHIF